MNEKKLTLAIIIVLAVAGGAFYGGMIYAKGKNSTGGSNQSKSDFANLSPEQRQQRFLQADGTGRTGGTRQFGAGSVNGEIISHDDKSITVKLRDGGSKIVFYSDSTEISKFTAGASSDLEVGKTVMVNGSANQDGSVTASLIQVRPENNVPDQK